MNNLANHPAPGKDEKSHDPERARRQFAYSAKAEYTREQQREAWLYIRRKLRCDLSPSEYMLVDFIADRTIEWQKPWEQIRLSQFKNGSLPDKNGEQLFCGTGMSERTIRDALKRLESRRIVARRCLPGGRGLEGFALRLPCLPDPVQDDARPRQILPVTPAESAALNPKRKNPQRTSLRSGRCAQLSDQKSEAGEEKQGAAGALPAGKAQPGPPAPAVRKRTRSQAWKARQRREPCLLDMTETDIEIMAGVAEHRDRTLDATEGPAGAGPASAGASVHPRGDMPASGPLRASGKRPGVGQAWRAWKKVFERRFALVPAEWDGHEKAKLADAMDRVPLPDASMTWEGFLSWIVERWGEANAAARPQAFRHEANTARIIQAPPTIRKVLYNLDPYLHAFDRLYYGSGLDHSTNALADDLQRRYEHHMSRAALKARQGADALPSDMLTPTELMNDARRLGDTDDDMKFLLRRRKEEQREIFRRTFRSGGDRARAVREMEQEKAAHRVREGWERNEQDPAFADILRGHEGQFDAEYFED